MTMRYDGHTHDTGKQALTVIEIENSADKTVFQKFIDPGENSEDINWVALAITDEMK